MDSKRRDKGLFKSESSRQSTDYPGMWRVPRNPEKCCIYRVPNSIRRVNPEAYTPQLLLIGPLHHSLKIQALKSRGDITNTKSMDYLNMEAHKKFYLAEFAQRFDGEETIDGFRRIIEENEEIIRESYSESTAWIEPLEFVEMILHDSVFIIEFIMRLTQSLITNPGDPLMVEHCLASTIMTDLMLLENQLPYFILEKLFDPILSTVPPNQSLRQMKGIIVNHMGQHGSVAEMVNKLSLGLGEIGSYYSDITVEVNAYYTNPVNRSRAVLKSVYFANLWTGTATVAAAFLLLMTLIQTVTSIIQVVQNTP